MSLEKFGSGDPFWGSTIISLMFLPNIAFFFWFIHGYWKNLCKKEGILKVLALSMVQIVTLIR